MGQAYWDRVRASIAKFRQPGQELRCTNIYTQDAGTCQMCGHHPIKWHHVLHNQQTDDKMIVGSECINNYKLVTGAQIVFPERFKRAAKYLNDRYPDCVVIAPDPVRSCPELEYRERPGEYDERYEMYDALGLDPQDPDFGELAAEGLDPDEYDWDSHDYDPD
jgi:hypothetical protein